MGILLPFHYFFSMFFDRFLFNVSSPSGGSMAAFSAVQWDSYHRRQGVLSMARRRPLLGSWLHCWMHCRNTNPCAVHTTLGDPGGVPHLQPQGTVLLISLHSYRRGLILVLAAGAPTLILASCGACASCPERCPWLRANWKELITYFILNKMISFE